MNLAEPNFEPPLSPPLSDGLRRAPLERQPDPEPEPAPPPAPAVAQDVPLPTKLLQSGLVTLPQLSAAMQYATDSGRPLQDVLVENGLVARETMAALEAPPAAPAPPPLAPVLAPEPDLEPAPVPAPEPAPAAALRFAVVAELENGSKIELGVYAAADAARDTAAHAMRAVAHATDEWPLLGGRYVRPTAVVAIEVAALL